MNYIEDNSQVTKTHIFWAYVCIILVLCGILIGCQLYDNTRQIQENKRRLDKITYDTIINDSGKQVIIKNKNRRFP